MDQRSEHTTEVPVPTAGRVAVRALPAATVMTAGLPLVFRVQLLDGSGDSRSHWWLAAFIALSGLGVLVHRYARAPRPRIVPRVGPAQLKSALATAARGGAVPQDPDVRIAAGAVACRSIEARVGAGGVAAGLVRRALLLPGFPWFAALGGATFVALVAALRTRHSWAYLQTWHAARSG